MALTKTSSLSALLTCLLLCLASARPGRRSPTGLDLATRLQAISGGGALQCWDSLLQLRSCTGEVILFFLNGEAYLGPSCCRAIRVIEHSCWPAMLGALGFTAEEGDVLRGYCDASNVEGPLPPTPPAAQGPGSVSTEAAA